MLHAVPHSGSPPNVKHSVNDGIWPVPSKRGRSGREAPPHSPWGRKRCRTRYIGSVPREDHRWPVCHAWGQPRGVVVAWAPGTQLPPPASPAALRAKAPIRGRRGSKRGFACHGYTLPQPNSLQMSPGAPPARSLIYGRRSREGKMRGSRGGSNKHGHYTCKYSTLRSFSALPLSTPVYFPITNKLVAVLRVSGYKGLRGGAGRSRPAAGAAALVVSIPVPAPGPARPRGCARAEPLPTPACPAGREPRGSPEAPAVSGTENKAGASPPHRPAQTSSLEYLPVFHGSFPWGQGKQKLLRGRPCPLAQTHPPRVPAGAAASRGPAMKRGCADTGALLSTPQLWYLWP